MERWKTIGWFLFTILALLSLVPPSDNNATKTGRPTSENERAPGLAALVRWLRSASIPVHSQRVRLEGITDIPITAAGNILITHLPSKLIFETDEVHSLLNWVNAGNTLVVATGHLEGTPWVYEGRDLSHSLWRLTGLKLVRDDSANSDEVDNEQPLGGGLMEATDEVLATPGWLLLHGARNSVVLQATGAHPLTDQLKRIQVPWDRAHWNRKVFVASTASDDAESQDDTEKEAESPTWPWTADINSCRVEADAVTQSIQVVDVTARQSRLLRGRESCLSIPTPTEDVWQTLLRHKATDQPALFVAPLGAGQLVVLLHASLLDNEVIHRFDNRTFTQSLITQYLKHGGTVIVDDAHQGLNDILEVSDLLGDSRFYTSIGFVLFFWLAYLLADSGQWQRATYKHQLAKVSQRDLVLGNANFLRRRLHPTATIEAILDPLRAQLATKWNLSRQTALAQGLAFEQPRQPKAVARLEELLAMVERRQTVSLPTLQKTVHELINA